MAGHWYDVDDVVDTFNMLKRFDQAGLGLYKNGCFSCAFIDDNGSYFTTSCADALAKRKGSDSSFLATNDDVIQAREDENVFFDKIIENELGLSGKTSVMQKVHITEYALGVLEKAKIPMEEYVSPDKNFNSLFRACPELVVMADVLSSYEWGGTSWEFCPFGRAESFSISQIAGLIPGMKKDFMEHNRGGIDMLASTVYGRLDADGNMIYWIEPECLLESGKGKTIQEWHYLYSPASRNHKFLDFSGLCSFTDYLNPSSLNPRTCYLMHAENIDPRIPQPV